MARLPSIPNEMVVTPQVRSSVSGEEVAKYSGAGLLAQAFGGVGDALVKIGDKYEAGVEVARTAQEVQDASTVAMKLAQEAAGDPEAFQKSWDAYVNGRLPSIPRQFQADIGAKFTAIGGNTKRSIIGQTMERDQKVATDRIDSRQSTLIAQMTDMARNGQTETPEYKSAHDEYVGLTNAKITNPFFAYSKEHADLDLDATEDTLTGAAVSGQLERVYAKDGYIAAQKRAQEIYADDSDGLDKVKKLKAIQSGLKSLNALYTADTQTRRQFSADRQETVAAMKDGTLAWDDPLVEEMKRTADALHDPVSRLSLESAQGVARLNPMRTLDLHGQMNFIKGIASTAPIVNGVDIGHARDAIAGIESGGHYGILGPVLKSGDRAYGKYQVMGANIPAWTKEALGQSMTPEQFLASPQAQDAVFDKIFGGYVEKYGNASDAASAWFTGKPLAEGADLRDVFGTSGKGYVNQFLFNYGSGASPLSDFTKGVVPEVRKQIGASLTSALTAAETALSHDQPLDAGQMQDMIDAARIVDDADTYDKVAATFARSATVSAMLGVAIPDQAALVDQLRAPGPKGDEALRLATLDQAISTQKNMAKLLADDPRALGVQIGLFGPGPAIDFTNVDQAPAILAARVPEMQRLATAERSGPLSVLRPDEAKAMAAAWTANTDPNQRTGLLGALVQSLPPDTLMATLAQFADKDDTKMLAVAGALMATNPDAGAAVVRGLAAIAADPKFAFATTDADYLVKKDEVFPSTIVTQTDAGLKGWQAHLDAARAVYAAKSQAAGESSGKFDETRWTDSINQVTGGILEFNGQKIIAPRPDIDQRRFDEIMAALPAGAFRGATTQGGTPITPEFFRRQFHLQNIGDGQYIMVDSAGSVAIRAPVSPSEAGIGGPFDLDTRSFLEGGQPEGGAITDNLGRIMRVDPNNPAKKYIGDPIRQFLDRPADPEVTKRVEDIIPAPNQPMNDPDKVPR